MTALILGSNGSGKSAYAEKWMARFPARARYYIATMVPYGAEGKARVEKHRAQRGAEAFITVEKPFLVSEIALPPGASVLLEDVSNLLSNAMFDRAKDGNADSVYADITALCGKCGRAVLVSIDGITALPEYNDETREYIDALNKVNQRLHAFADAVITMRGGTPHLVKGDIHALG
jgi:adenosylcobinamide kinase/adenosylcobinamide-phosphate guanylyltransferase